MKYLDVVSNSYACIQNRENQVYSGYPHTYDIQSRRSYLDADYRRVYLDNYFLRCHIRKYGAASATSATHVVHIKDQKHIICMYVFYAKDYNGGTEWILGYRIVQNGK